MSYAARHQNAENLLLEIMKKEKLAEDAKKKGMFTTFSNYKADVAQLKMKLKRYRTDPTL